MWLLVHYVGPIYLIMSVVLIYYIVCWFFDWITLLKVFFALPFSQMLSTADHHVSWVSVKLPGRRVGLWGGMEWTPLASTPSPLQHRWDININVFKKLNNFLPYSTILVTLSLYTLCRFHYKKLHNRSIE